jgi:hypothetical protein
MNRKIEGIEKIGWFGLASGWISLIFPIYSFAYFIGSLIFMAYKWGDEPLWGKKE